MTLVPGGTDMFEEFIDEVALAAPRRPIGRLRAMNQNGDDPINFGVTRAVEIRKGEA